MSQSQEESDRRDRLAFITEACCPLVFGEHMTDHKPQELGHEPESED